MGRGIGLLYHSAGDSRNPCDDLDDGDRCMQPEIALPQRDVGNALVRMSHPVLGIRTRLR